MIGALDLIEDKHLQFAIDELLYKMRLLHIAQIQRYNTIKGISFDHPFFENLIKETKRICGSEKILKKSLAEPDSLPTKEI